MMDVHPILQGVFSVVIFGVIGIVLFALAVKLIAKVVPFSLEKEIAEDQNTALGIVMGAIIIGLAIIVAAAIHG
jgi:putative membrane protein